MKVTTAMWVHRTIRSNKEFVDARDDPSLHEKYDWVDSPIIGVYLNPEGVVPKEIVVGEKFIFPHTGQHGRKICFADIVSYALPQKGSGEPIRLTLRDESKEELLIAGRDGRFEDVYSFARFLMRVIPAINS